MIQNFPAAKSMIKMNFAYYIIILVHMPFNALKGKIMQCISDLLEIFSYSMATLKNLNLYYTCVEFSVLNKQRCYYLRHT